MVDGVLEQPALEGGMLVAHRTHRPFEARDGEGPEVGGFSDLLRPSVCSPKTFHVTDHGDHALLLRRVRDRGRLRRRGCSGLLGKDMNPPTDRQSNQW